MIKWIKTLLRVVKEFDEVVDYLDKRLIEAEVVASNAEQVIRDRTNLHVDMAVHSSQPSTVIVAGLYNNRQYVRTFNIHHTDFSHLVNYLKEMQRYAKLSTVDVPPQMSWVIDEIKE